MYYQEELGLEKYQEQYEMLCNELKGHNLKIEDTEACKCVNKVDQETQTESYSVRLSDLSNL